MRKRAVFILSLVFALWSIDATAAIKKHQNIVVVATTTKVAKPHSVPKAVKPIVLKKKVKPKPPSSEVCLARLILGEAGLEALEGRKAVAYVAVKYAKTLKRTICKEVYSGRYSWALSKPNRRTVAATKGEPWREAKRVAISMIHNPVPPDPRLRHATTYYVPSDSSESGRKWIEENTYQLDIAAASDVQIGNHVFREERVHANRRGIIIPRQKPKQEQIATRSPPIPLRMKPTKLIALSAIENAASSKHE